MDHVRGESTPVIPTLIALIYAIYVDPKSPSESEYLALVEGDLGAEIWKPKTTLINWLKEPTKPDWY
ncbi:hypothetical protein E1B28_009446 [Marasmius oreades]|uniref:Uncharacterized protein n=1 Tax=Marasmius oreades TaxID=181124 RepID=A0A9P7S0I8_9AGAR|nr:uncharacterized protein E1B28_009446 [Marasmius oreades]KAG7093164.1 hypothetical protein E1B28_009446 [Marasmius oreades]